MSSLVTSCGLFLACLLAIASETASFAQQIDDAKAESTIVASEANKPTQFFWQSEVLNKDAVQNELAKLYVTLHLNGVLNTEAITIEKSETPTDIMIRAGVWPKWLVHRMPAELEIALCDLNKAICSVSGDGKTSADWSNAWPERTMNVPDVELKLSYQLSGRDWEDFNAQVVEVDTIETSDFIAMWCRQFPGAVEMCRSRDIKQGWAADEPAIFKYVDDSGTRHKEYAAVGDPVALQRLGASTSPFKMVAVPVIEATVELKDSSPGGFSRITRSLSDRVLVEQKLRLESIAEQNKLPYSLMGFADANGEWRLPWPDDVTPTPIRIAHIDASADLNHCAFGEGVVFKRYVVDPVTEVGRLEQVVRPTAPTTASTSVTGAANAIQPACGQVDAHPLEQVSHGTHTLGILVDLLTLGGRADPAVDPEIPPIVIYHVPVDLSPANAAGMAQLYKAIEQFPSWGVSLVNISASWNITDTRPIERAIDRLKNQVLFVVAAGNEQQANSCTVSPACIKSKNVISVVALGADAQQRLMVLDQSNRGLDHDIGAFGADIVSAVSNNRFGKFSGTSQAAPLVSAVVAHLMRRGGLGIDSIYERILTTARLDSNLLGASQATMIDMNRAVDVDSDFLDLDNGCQIKGRMEDFVRDPDLDEKLVLTEVDSDGEFKVSPDDLRRVFFNKTEGWHLVMYARGRKLVRGTYFIDEQHLNREFRFRPTDLSNCNGPQIGAVEKFKLADIKDLTVSPH